MARYRQSRMSSERDSMTNALIGVAELAKDSSENVAKLLDPPATFGREEGRSRGQRLHRDLGIGRAQIPKERKIGANVKRNPGEPVSHVWRQRTLWELGAKDMIAKRPRQRSCAPPAIDRP
jgi:hypothetical protein